MLTIVSTLSSLESKIRKNIFVEELNKVNGNLNKLTGKDVRIVYLPSMAMAYAMGEGNEGKVNDIMHDNRICKENGFLKSNLMSMSLTLTDLRG